MKDYLKRIKILQNRENVLSTTKSKITFIFFKIPDHSELRSTSWTGSLTFLLIAGGILFGIFLIIIVPTTLGIILTRNPSGK